MSRRHFALVPLVLVAALAAQGSAMGHDSQDASTPAPARAALLDAGGTAKGTATISKAGSGLRLVVDATGLVPGAHGFHIHAAGTCEPPAFASAGPHWNPVGKVHGKDVSGGPHMGDLPNLIVAADGQGHLEITVPDAQLSAGATPLLDSDGAAIVIHAAADDYKTDPSGNSGARIVCGVFKLS